MEVISTKKAPAAIGPYEQAIKAGNTLYISGQVPFVPETMEIISEDVKDQTRQCLDNIKAILEAADYMFKDVAKVGIFIKNMDDFTLINEVYAEYFNEHKAARFCVEVSRLPRDVKIEIDAIAYKE